MRRQYMADKKAFGCTRPTSIVEETAKGEEAPVQPATKQGGNMVTVGKKAPDFSAPAFFNNEFTSVNLSDYS